MESALDHWTNPGGNGPENLLAAVTSCQKKGGGGMCISDGFP